MDQKKITLLTSFFVGLVFALGLGLSGMTQPQKVVAFLDVFGDWDPSLAFVMLGAIVVHASLYPLIMKKRKSPLNSDRFQFPSQSQLSPKLFVGSALFGSGWGLAGYCPGPAVTSLASGQMSSLIFVLAMISGMFLYKITQSYFK